MENAAGKQITSHGSSNDFRKVGWGRDFHFVEGKDTGKEAEQEVHPLWELIKELVNGL